MIRSGTKYVHQIAYERKSICTLILIKSVESVHFDIPVTLIPNKYACIFSFDDMNNGGGNEQT